jgi:hypothetical protein
MPYFKIYNCLFIHIPETDGDSVEQYFIKKLFRPLTNFDLYTERKNNTNFHNVFYQTYQHMSYSTILENKYLLLKNFNIDIDTINKFFTIVKNPYERIVSFLLHYGYITINTPKECVFTTLKERIYSSQFTDMIIPQYKFILDEKEKINRKIVIMKSESLKQDMIKFGFKDFNQCESKNKYNYLDLLDSHSIELINDYYSKDFDFFDYKKIITKNRKIIFISIANNLQKTEYLAKSASIWNICIHIIYIELWKGFIDKITKVREYILKFDDDDIICFVDAYDVLMLSSEKDILQKFYNYNCRILFGTELNCFPESNLETYNNYYKNKTQINNYNYLNSGGYIGYKKDIYDMLKWKPDSEIAVLCEDGGDQNYFTKYFFENESYMSIKFDYTQMIFQNVTGVDINTFVFRNGHLYNTILHTYPCIIHFNGFFDMDVKTVTDIKTNKDISVLELFMYKLKKSINGKVQTFNHMPPYGIISQK